MSNALLVYPKQPPTYWGNNYALDLQGIKAVFPPLGLLTVAAMFPSRYNLRVVDLNVTPLEDDDLEWADLAFTSTMIPQRPRSSRSLSAATARGFPSSPAGRIPPRPDGCHDRGRAEQPSIPGADRAPMQARSGHPGRAL